MLLYSENNFLLLIDFNETLQQFVKEKAKGKNVSYNSLVTDTVLSIYIYIYYRVCIINCYISHNC